MYRLPTTDAINAYLDCVNFGEARIIRAHLENWRAGDYTSNTNEHPSHSVAVCLKHIDAIMGPFSSHGVESCTQDNLNDDYLDSDKWTAQYVNTGDTYTPTIIFLTEGHPRFASGFKLLCLGDLYE